MRQANYIACLSMVIFTLACKPQGSSETQSLDNFTGSQHTVNACVGANAIMVVEPIVEIDETVRQPSKESKAITEAAGAALSSVPEALRSVFFSTGGSIRVSKTASKYCASALASPVDRLYASEGGSLDSCWQVERNGVVRIYLSADPAAIRHNLVRMFGRVLSDVLVDLPVPDVKQTAAHKDMQALRDSMVTALERDLAASGLAADSVFAQIKARPDAAESLKRYAFAEAFDSYYCSVGTRMKMMAAFPATARVMTRFDAGYLQPSAAYWDAFLKVPQRRAAPEQVSGFALGELVDKYVWGNFKKIGTSFAVTYKAQEAKRIAQAREDARYEAANPLTRRRRTPLYTPEEQKMLDEYVRDTKAIRESPVAQAVGNAALTVTGTGDIARPLINAAEKAEQVRAKVDENTLKAAATGDITVLTAPIKEGLEETRTAAVTSTSAAYKYVLNKSGFGKAIDGAQTAIDYTEDPTMAMANTLFGQAKELNKELGADPVLAAQQNKRADDMKNNLQPLYDQSVVVDTSTAAGEAAGAAAVGTFFNQPTPAAEPAPINSGSSFEGATFGTADQSLPANVPTESFDTSGTSYEPETQYGLK